MLFLLKISPISGIIGVSGCAKTGLLGVFGISVCADIQV